MPANSSHRRSIAAAAPLVVLVSEEGTQPLHATRLERAGFEVRVCQTPEEGRHLLKGASLCDASLARDNDLSNQPMEQLVRARLEALLDRLGEEPVAGLHALVMREVERGLVRLVLERCKGHKGKASLQLGLHRNTLRQKTAELGLDGTGTTERRPRRVPRHRSGHEKRR